MPPQAFTPNEMRSKMTIQAETKNETTTENAELADILKELGEVGDVVAKGEAAKARRIELMKLADARNVSPTKIAELAKTTRKMVYHNRDKVAGAGK
jgi:hypothetical protein